MIRILNIILAMGALAAAITAYGVKTEARRLRETERAIANDVASKRTLTAALRAEMAYLESPDYLQGLSAQFAEELRLQQRGAAQLVQPENIPFPPNRDSVQGESQ